MSKKGGRHARRRRRFQAQRVIDADEALSSRQVAQARSPGRDLDGRSGPSGSAAVPWGDRESGQSRFGRSDSALGDGLPRERVFAASGQKGGAGGLGEHIPAARQILTENGLEPAKPNLDPAKAYKQAYDAFFKQALELAQNPGTMAEAVDAFTKAIKLAPDKTQMTLTSLDQKILPIYKQAIDKSGIQAPNALGKEGKKKSNTLKTVLLALVHC